MSKGTRVYTMCISINVVTSAVTYLSGTVALLTKVADDRGYKYYN